MKKVLTERPRRGHANCYHEVRRRLNRGNLEDLPHCQGMRVPYMAYYGENAKEFSDLLGPLKRFLRSCVGRNWDEVWSEICSQLSDNTVDSHLKGHVKSEVDTQTVLVNGEILVRGKYGSEYSPYGLYVDPCTGRLAIASARRSVWKTDEKLVNRDGIVYRLSEDGVLYPYRERRHFPRKLIGQAKEAFQVDGIWYWAVFATVPPAPIRQTPDGPVTLPISRVDIVTGQVVTQGRYRADKRQMAGRDLRRYGLVNG